MAAFPALLIWVGQIPAVASWRIGMKIGITIAVSSICMAPVVWFVRRRVSEIRFYLFYRKQYPEAR
jgi:hypothetical protein